MTVTRAAGTKNGMPRAWHAPRRTTSPSVGQVVKVRGVRVFPQMRRVCFSKRKGLFINSLALALAVALSCTRAGVRITCMIEKKNIEASRMCASACVKLPVWCVGGGGVEVFVLVSMYVYKHMYHREKGCVTRMRVCVFVDGCGVGGLTMCVCGSARAPRFHLYV